MKDVAARAGVGLKTVSRVVNDEPGVLPDTAALVRKAIDELGFRRNDSARQLRTGRTGGIGLVLDDVADPYYCLLAGAVEQVARKHGSLLFAASSQDDPRRESELALALCERRVDGLIIVPAAHDHSYLAPELDAGMTVVFADRPPVNLAADAVLADNREGARQGVRHLLDHGHRRIAFIGGDPRRYPEAERLRGYRAAMAEARVLVDEAWIAHAAPAPEGIRSTLSRMLDEAGDPPRRSSPRTTAPRWRSCANWRPEPWAARRSIQRVRHVRRWWASTTSNWRTCWIRRSPSSPKTPPPSAEPAPSCSSSASRATTHPPEPSPSRPSSSPAAPENCRRRTDRLPADPALYLSSCLHRTLRARGRRESPRRPRSYCCLLLLLLLLLLLAASTAITTAAAYYLTAVATAAYYSHPYCPCCSAPFS
jgi:DNA-binding LacI/PurR family transcriptional regulator